MCPYPPFLHASELDDESDLVDLDPDTAAQARDLRMHCKKMILKVREYYVAVQTQLESEHWGEWIIFHVPTGKYVVGQNVEEVEARFASEVSTTDSYGFRIGG
ncbi:hypothetical protein FJY93_00790 [Candidatus Kaiserbacteria bacterium]|nr:hypothetical protein [Candidatus Kaiserbacteria bacterium]